MDENELKKIKNYWSKPWDYQEEHKQRNHIKDIEWLIEQIEEYQQWFEKASDNIQSMKKEIEQLEEDNYDLRIESGNI